MPALIKLGDPDLAKALGELIGEVPNPLLARTLGGILNRQDFGPEAARVQVVRALAKIPGDEAIHALRKYVTSLPEESDAVRQSRREAKAFIKDRLKKPLEGTGAKRAPKPAPKGGGQ